MGQLTWLHTCHQNCVKSPYLVMLKVIKTYDCVARSSLITLSTIPLFMEFSTNKNCICIVCHLYESALYSTSWVNNLHCLSWRLILLACSMSFKKEIYYSMHFAKKMHLQLVFEIMNYILFQNDLMGICQDNLAIIIDCLQSAELQDTFVSKRKSRDLRGESKQN